MVTCLPIVHPLFASSRIRSGVRQVFQSALLPTLPFDTGYPIKVTAPGWTPVDYFIQAQVRVAEVFRDAVRQQATAIVAVHNHPSGDPTPSAADVALTVEIVAAGQLLDIELLDHLIIGQGRWLSLKRLGLGFAKA